MFVVLVYLITLLLISAAFFLDLSNKSQVLDVETLSYVDYYYSTFSQIDYSVRNNPSLNKFIKCLRHPTKQELAILKENTDKVDRDYPKLANLIPWKFIVFSQNMENKFPHTHGRFIFIHEDHIENIGYVTLFHEKIHVYQRFYPCETNLLLAALGYTFHGISDNMGRSNPDINNIVYMDVENKVIDNSFVDGATDLTHITDARDHPYEIMAYEISHIDRSCPIINRWVREYFV